MVEGGMKKLGSAGQSTVEFALTLILLMGLILFYLQLTLVFSYGNYVQLRTFMSARAFLSSGPDRKTRSTGRGTWRARCSPSAARRGSASFPSP